MNFSAPVESVIPGVQGRVLGVLARTDTELTMRSVARLAGVSVNRAGTVLNQLVALGLVERREMGPSALVRLDLENEAARTVLDLQDLSARVVDRLRTTADAIRPAPRSLVLFGSFVRGRASSGSDLDVVAVRPRNTGSDDIEWDESLGRWSDLAARIAGNPVNVLIASEDELPRLLKRKGAWRDAAREGMLLIGTPLEELAAR